MELTTSLFLPVCSLFFILLEMGIMASWREKSHRSAFSCIHILHFCIFCLYCKKSHNKQYCDVTVWFGVFCEQWWWGINHVGQKPARRGSLIDGHRLPVLCTLGPFSGSSLPLTYLYYFLGRKLPIQIQYSHVFLEHRF